METKKIREEKYEEAVMEIIELSEEDIIRTSACLDCEQEDGCVEL